MSNHDPRTEFVQSLLKQDRSVTEAQYKEYRQMLDHKIAQAARREKSSRIATWIVWSMVVVCWGGPSVLLPLLNGGAHPALQSVAITAVFLGGVFFWYGVFRLFRYVLWDRRNLADVQQESRDAVLLELQRKVDELSERHSHSSS